uniref:NADH-plastoquinone oxidoreductase subunit 3 n=1 Tax=Corydalis trisecta TaxID=2682942 RepID=UPI001FAF6732|nr:NADH-plastoquinone oxidoreductase subunit 3 [Corydalis trisecta]ULX45332.1 NADH-plastoquinone oxidoreductase subunit 3 [Corydalis trisecta]
MSFSIRTREVHKRSVFPCIWVSRSPRLSSTRGEPEDCKVSTGASSSSVSSYVNSGKVPWGRTSKPESSSTMEETASS